MPKRLPYTVVCKDTDPRWLELRRAGIGASSMAAAMGVNKCESPYSLCLELMGDVDPPDLSDNEHVYWGKKLEPVVMQGYAEKSGRLAWRSGLLLRSNQYPWALCTLDGMTAETDAPRKRWPLEIKTGTIKQASEWTDGPPEHYRVQTHMQMLVTGSEVVTAAALLGGYKFAWCDVERDDALIRRIIAAGSEFMDRVKRRDPPPIDATEACTSTIERRYRISDPSLAIRLPNEFAELDERREKLKKREAAARKEIALIDNQLKARIGGAERATLPNGVVYTWRSEKRDGYVVQPSVSRVLRRTEDDK